PLVLHFPGSVMIIIFIHLVSPRGFIIAFYQGKENSSRKEAKGKQRSKGTFFLLPLVTVLVRKYCDTLRNMAMNSLHG
ncbi:MAG TPA: hypothetical protein DDY25_04750, partial [Peptococcaceae bacterium]|nr:hypothetical protein [Peptococcaceae bacterium]